MRTPSNPSPRYLNARAGFLFLPSLQKLSFALPLRTLAGFWMLLTPGLVNAEPPKSSTTDPFPGLARTIAELAGEKGHPLQRDPALDRAALVHAAHLGADPERANLESVFESIQNEGLADAQVLPFSILAAPEEGAVALRRFAEIEARPRGAQPPRPGPPPGGVGGPAGRSVFPPPPAAPTPDPNRPAWDPDRPGPGPGGGRSPVGGTLSARRAL
jgi:hypothetical protein